MYTSLMERKRRELSPAELGEIAITIEGFTNSFKKRLDSTDIRKIAEEFMLTAKRVKEIETYYIQACVSIANMSARCHTDYAVIQAY